MVLELDPPLTPAPALPVQAPKDIYTVRFWNAGGPMRDLRGLSFASACGHVPTLAKDYERIVVLRDSDGVLVMKFDVDGFDL